MNNMKNLIIVRRVRNIGNNRLYNQPILKLEFPQGRFILSKVACTNIGIKQDDGLMFGFNRSEKKAYLFKDDEPDSFRVRIKDKASMRLTSKDLMVHFIECFKLEMNTPAYFLVSKKADEKNRFQLPPFDHDR